MLPVQPYDSSHVSDILYCFAFARAYFFSKLVVITWSNLSIVNLLAIQNARQKTWRPALMCPF